MNHLSYMEKLLDGVEVEWKKLADVFQLKNGYTPSKSKKEFWENGTVPWFRMDDIRENGQILDESLQKVSESAIKGGKLFPENSIIIATSATIGEHALIRVPFLANQRFTNLSLKPVYKDTFNNKFIFYYCFMLADWCKKNTTMSSFASVDMDGFKKYPFPIPCPNDPKKSLEIQAEIVRILDAFTAMTAELNMRKKQYNYYRDQLLSFDLSADQAGEGEVEWKNLEDVASFRRGSFPQPYGNSEWYDGEGCMPFVQVADVADFGFTLHQTTKQKISKLAQPKSVFVEKGTVVVSLQGTIGRVAITQYDSYVDRTLAIFTSYKEDINKKYFAHQLKAKFDLEKEFARGSTLKTITKQEFSKFQIPIPPIEEQNRIVALLDKFDTLTHSIKEGLPREIELRQKQYEYYRDLLLSFPASPAGGPKSHSDEAA